MPADASITKADVAPAESTNPPTPFREFWYAFSENRGALIAFYVIVGIFTAAILADVIAPHNPSQQFREFVRIPPAWMEGGMWQYVLGTDDLGRDLLSRIIHGARVSLSIGVSVAVISVMVGIVLGLFAAFEGGIIDTVIMRVMDLIIAVPGLVLAILIVAIIGPSLMNTIVAVIVVNLPRYVRLVRASALTELGKEYVTAARVAGVGKLRLMFVTVLPNCLAPLIVQTALGLSEAILEAAALGFLGLGAQPPLAEWGAMVGDGREFMRSNPWIITFPGLAILVTVISINLMGDGLRDALDPKLRRS